MATNTVLAPYSMMKFLSTRSSTLFMLILALEFDVYFLQQKPKRTSSSCFLFVESFSPSSMLTSSSSRSILLIQPKRTLFYYKNHCSSHHRVLSSIVSSIGSIDDNDNNDNDNDNNCDPPNNSDVSQDHADDHSSSNTSDQELLDWIFSEEFGGILGSTENSIILSTTSKKHGHGKRRRRRRGVYVTKDFPSGSIIFQIPLSSALIIEEIETTDAERGAKLLEILFSSESEANNNSKWQIYRNSLPTRNEHFDSTPDFWTDEQIRRLEFARLVKEVLQRKKRIENLAIMENNNTITRNENYLPQLQFATWLTESRSLTLVKEPYPDCPEDELQTTSIMIPLVDMINHECHTPNSELQVIDNGDDDGTLSYAVVAVDDIKSGEEITISYGTGEESSVELLQYYGFVPESNEYDMDMLSRCLEEDDDDCLISHDEWSTTLEDDEERLKELLSHQQSQDEKDSSKVERTILEFRIRMKHAWNELQEEWERDDDEDEEYDDDDD